ncbi:Gamma-interferon inducible lysosomal thiol reductase [Handroanthus impetiginosus]|uniref:Gamma-interferon inducible lysosomal thiol reductase n=1 Tax=Handroanthus impetiginosus TaxID=429701 RepID=A0A2G9GQT6_9LAMI|nr:Gamma-interferon inducible lysosomal thiol reductase [Handroanthus impetiginosus]
MDALRLILILSLLSFSSSAVAADNGGEKVTLGLYYESLCPYCSNLIVNYLYKLFESDLISITDLELIPYGNAKVHPNGTITCQHGPYECLLNTVEACAIDVWPDVKDHFPFIYCVESLVYQHNYTYWETCFEKLGLDASPVTDCYKGKRGTELILRYAAKTNALQPPHRYVPWVVVDGQPLYDDYRNFAYYICKAYKGTTKPTACTGLSFGLIRKVKMNLFDTLYGDKISQSKLFEAVQAILSWLQRNKTVASL